ncbi:Cleavage stimulation factor subunit [Fasciolopsis buskii]|uniref:Cleavage stimulation factor 50 kDa subunit n=1 Tax=Fasciolopsis buskii TaxID=27845 RepID=A0A8E0VP52_9TREM|nr:Cleavage stimulation factor subunit [Fasciolopsis buski]
MAPEAALYETCYVTAHKAACRAASFNVTGQLVATGSHDSSIKILDVERMLAKSVSPADHLGQETPQQQMETHPVIRTLYDHTAEVTCVDFHPDPSLQILVSGSKDYTIKLFDFSNPSVKKAQRNIPEASPIRTLHFHPSGNFLLVGTQHKTLRLYDVQTCRCYVSAVPEDQHQSAVNMVRWSPNGNAYVTAGMDGSFKIWDGVSCRCVNTFESAHDGAPVCSVMFSRNGKYILSSGKDSAVKLWELATGRCLITYTGAGTTGHQTHRSMAVFNHTEDYVLFPDEATKSLCCWDSRNADRQRLLALSKYSHLSIESFINRNVILFFPKHFDSMQKVFCAF